MQQSLKDLLQTAGVRVDQQSLPYVRTSDVDGSVFEEEVMRVYRRRGGLLHFSLGFRGWDLDVEGVAVELDEDLHFNRYRATTLRSALYENLKTFPLHLYQEYCNRFEKPCLEAGRYGGRWTNRSCEGQFGGASKLGELDGSGAPRWKQRAFYDFVKDLTPLILGQPVVRLAVWDCIAMDGKARHIRDVLTNRWQAAAEPVMALIRSRVSYR